MWYNVYVIQPKLTGKNNRNSLAKGGVGKQLAKSIAEVYMLFGLV